MTSVALHKAFFAALNDVIFRREGMESGSFFETCQQVGKGWVWTVPSFRRRFDMDAHLDPCRRLCSEYNTDI